MTSLLDRFKGRETEPLSDDDLIFLGFSIRTIGNDLNSVSLLSIAQEYSTNQNIKVSTSHKDLDLSLLDLII